MTRLDNVLSSQSDSYLTHKLSIYLCVQRWVCAELEMFAQFRTSFLYSSKKLKKKKKNYPAPNKKLKGKEARRKQLQLLLS